MRRAHPTTEVAVGRCNTHRLRWPTQSWSRGKQETSTEEPPCMPSSTLCAHLVSRSTDSLYAAISHCHGSQHHGNAWTTYPCHASQSWQSDLFAAQNMNRSTVHLGSYCPNSVTISSTSLTDVRNQQVEFSKIIKSFIIKPLKRMTSERGWPNPTPKGIGPFLGLPSPDTFGRWIGLRTVSSH